MAREADGRRILFVCLHGSAKSLIAAEHLNRLAALHGVHVRGESAGLEPDADVPPDVVSGLASDGIDVRAYRPRQITPELIAAAAHVVVCGCELPGFTSPVASLERWDDLPFVSDGYDEARRAIVERVEHLLEAIRTSARLR